MAQEEPKLFQAIAGFGKLIVGDSGAKKTSTGVVAAGATTSVAGIVEGSLFFTLIGVVTTLLGGLTRLLLALKGEEKVVEVEVKTPAAKDIPMGVVDQVAEKHGKSAYQVDQLISAAEKGMGNLSKQLQNRLKDLEVREHQLNAREKGELEILRQVAALEAKKQMAGVS